MTPTIVKTVNQTFVPYREQPRSTRIVVAYPRPAPSETKRTNHAPNIFDNKSKFFKVTSCRKKGKCTEVQKHTEVDGDGGLELVQPALEYASPHPKPYASLIKRPTHPLTALVRRKQTVVRDQLSSQKPPDSRLSFSRTRVHHSPGSSTIELPSAFWCLLTR